MSAAQDHPSAFDGLEAARERVVQARGRVSVLEQEARRAAAAAEASMGPALSYFAEVGAGTVDADPAREAKLAAEVTRAHAFVRLRPGAGGRMEAVDERAEAQLSGARTALEEAEWASGEYVREHFDALATELAARAARDRDDLQAALGATVAARGAYLRTRALWRPLLEEMRLPTELPTDPLRGLSDELADVSELPLPMPLCLIPTTDPED